jgi:carbonic anhydrase
LFLINDILRANQAYARDFAEGGLPAPPAKQLVVLTCMDARLTPEDFLDLDLGDAHILRNAGAVATEDALRSLLLSTTLMSTRHVFVIGHTGCALDGADEDDLRAKTGADDVLFHAFDDLDGHVREQVEKIESSRLISDEVTVHGFVYQVEDGRLRQIV